MAPPGQADAATELVHIPPHETWIEVRPETARLGRYTLYYEIGVGGMASVYLARESGLAGFQRWVAVKRIHPHLSREPQFITMFLDEARLAARISHANITQVFELGESDGSWFLAMEYLHGETLSALARALARSGQRLPWQVSVRIVSQVCEGLHHAHELADDAGRPLDLVHRDISPQNVIVTYGGGVKIMDFGIAKAAITTSHTTTGVMKGKITYMSPEQIRATRPLDRRSDIFSLGIILWELVMGCRLFKGDSELETARRVSTADVIRPSSLGVKLPGGLEDLVMRALALEPEDRFATAEELQRELDTLLVRNGELVAASDLSALMRRTFADRIRVREGLLRAINAPSGSVPIFVEISSGESLSFGSLDLGQSLTSSRDRPSRRKWLLRAALILAGTLVGAGLIFAIGLGPSRRGSPASAVTFPNATERTKSPQVDASAAGSKRETSRDPADQISVPTPSPPSEEPASSARPPSSTGRETEEVSVPRVPNRRVEPGATTAGGFINVMTTPWSRVYLDGADIGPTPVVRYPASAGPHSVRLVWPDGRRKTVRLTVRPGRAASVVRGPP